MVCNPLGHELLLLALLWQLVFSYRGCKRGQATNPLSAQQPKKPPYAPKPFAGLTKKPPCETCEQDPDPSDQPPLSPPPRLAPKRGRPRTVDTQTQYCPAKTCPYYGWVGRGNVRANGHPGSRAWRQLHCVVCDTYFLETHGTLFYGKPRPAERIVQVVAALAEGLGLRAVARVLDVDPNTVRAWLSEAADHLKAFSRTLLHDMHVNHIQLDELFAVVSEAKAGQGRAAEASEPLPHSPHWVWVAIDPLSKLLLAFDVGERTLAMAQQLVHHVRQVLAPGCVPLFLSDGLKEYAMALLTHWGHWVPRPRWRVSGPTPKPRWMPRPELLYAQVVTTYRRRRLVHMRPRVVFGTLAQVRQVLAPRGWQINTAFIEQVNLTLRHHVAAVGRRVMTVAKSASGLRAQLHLYHAYYNFCLPHASLREACA
jgi:IS1 family transposase/transposase-like protein